MRKLLNIFGALLFAYFYCLATDSVIINRDNDVQKNSNTQNENFLFSTHQKSLSCILESERNLQSFDSQAHPDFNYLPNVFINTVSAFEYHIIVSFKQYFSYYLNFFTRFTIADIIFPFHYFW